MDSNGISGTAPARAGSLEVLECRPCSIPPRSRCGSCLPWPSSSCARSAGSVYLIRKHLAAGGDVLPDAVFWDVFAGLAIVAPAVILPALAAPWAGLLLESSPWPPLPPPTSGHPGCSAGRQPGAPPGTSQPATRRPPPGTAALLARWQRYELDPALSIDYPAMSDSRQPETAALIRAMKDAERLRGGTDAGVRPGRCAAGTGPRRRRAGRRRRARSPGPPRRIHQHGPGARLSVHPAR